MKILILSAVMVLGLPTWAERTAEGVEDMRQARPPGVSPGINLVVSQAEIAKEVVKGNSQPCESPKVKLSQEACNRIAEMIKGLPKDQQKRISIDLKPNSQAAGCLEKCGPLLKLPRPKGKLGPYEECTFGCYGFNRM